MLATVARIPALKSIVHALGMDKVVINTVIAIIVAIFIIKQRKCQDKSRILNCKRDRCSELTQNDV